MVELSEGIRKVRRLFLFHDIIVSSKQKPTRTGIKFELKWFLPLSNLTYHPPEESTEGQQLWVLVVQRMCALYTCSTVHVCVLFIHVVQYVCSLYM